MNSHLIKGRFRAGSVPHLNAVPLTRGLEEETLYLPPSKLAVKLRNNELDAALLSVTEAVFNDSYDILDGIAINSRGPVKSVFLAHAQPLEEIREIHCDTASLASLNLLKVLLAEKGLAPKLKPLNSYKSAATADNVFMIGDHALDFILAPHRHQIWDLGGAWFELTGLPFVFAVWTLRRDPANASLREALREAKKLGMKNLGQIIASRADYTENFRREYLTQNIRFNLDAEERLGLQHFVELLRKHNIGTAHNPHFVE